MIAIHNQQLADLTIEANGTIESLMDVAVANNISITDDLVIGQDYKANGPIIDTSVIAYYQSKGIKPATAITTETLQDLGNCEGISCWAIGVDFIVSED